MAAGTVDTLQIEIEVNSAGAVANINNVYSALSRIGTVSKTANTGLAGVISRMKSMNVVGFGASKILGGVRSALAAIGWAGVAKTLADSVTNINDYVENVNLFQVSMGRFYDEAFAYAELVNEKLSVDPSQWMRTQGVFMSMANGFGMTEDQAYQLSKSLTELSYDISSLYNEDVESAATRLQSALAGEIEPIRRLGISISQATLEEYALTKGINESVASMTEQEKALLRSLKLIEGARDIRAIGDFAKTLESPANAMRVLKQQLTQFSRALGSVLLPAVVQILPYLQAFVKLLTQALTTLATLVGFEMPEWDNSSWNEGFGGAADAVDDTTKSVKKLKKETLGIDELNIISPETGSGASLSGWAEGLVIPNLWDEAMLNGIDSKADEILERMKAAIENGDWYIIGATLAQKMNNALMAWDAYGTGRFIGEKLQDAINFAAGFLFTFDFSLLGQRIAELFNGIGSQIDFRTFGLTLAKSITTGFDFLIGFITTFDWGEAARAIGQVYVGFYDGLGNWLATVKWDELAVQMWSHFKNAVEGIDFAAIATSFFTFLGSAFAAGLEFLLTGFLEIANDVGEWWHTKMAEVGGNAWEGFKKGIHDAVFGVRNWIRDNIAIPFIEGINNVFGINSPSKVMAEIGGYMIDGLFEGLSGFGEKIRAWGSDFIQKVKDRLGIHSPSKEFEAIGEYSVAGMQQGFSGLYVITDMFGEQLEVMKSYAVNFSDEVNLMIDNGLNNFLNAMLEAQDTVLNRTNAMTTMFQNMSVRSVSAINSIISRLNAIPRHITTVHTIITRSVSEGGGGSVSGFASGGYPEQGQLFLAREAGPELVGTLGGKTAVANNSQIEAGIEQAAYRGFSRAIAEQQGGGNPIVVENKLYLDRKQLRFSLQQADRESGYNVSTGGVLTR